MYYVLCLKIMLLLIPSVTVVLTFLVLHMWICKRFTSDYGSRLCDMDEGQET